ncbi:hypothetical protein BDW71DRAFT_210713 [Aspergillus fruticulosus]
MYWAALNNRAGYITSLLSHGGDLRIGERTNIEKDRMDGKKDVFGEDMYPIISSTADYMDSMTSHRNVLDGLKNLDALMSCVKSEGSYHKVQRAMDANAYVISLDERTWKATCDRVRVFEASK